jgi:iron complex transport system ATP-binding protein
LRDGAMVASGPIREVLTSRTVSGAFDLSVEVEESDGRFTARATEAAGPDGVQLGQ